jgi:large subunit ribosomal protein L35
MKLKSHSGAKKRIKTTKKGLLLSRGAAISHLLTHKNRTSAKQHHQFNNPLSRADVKRVKKLLPYSSN